MIFHALVFQESGLSSDCKKIGFIFESVEKGTIDKKLASKELDSLFSLIPIGEMKITDTSWVFPLRNYSFKAVGGKNGNGYITTGYHFLDGNKHLAHPADDIFILDKDQDGLDDRNKKPVDVLAVMQGIVVSEQNEWDSKSPLRGGKYLWIYHPQFQSLTYYAHNQKLFVQIGDRVKKGQKIAEVGRTGFNAYKSRSTTHLHFSLFKLHLGIPVPINPYTYLKRADFK